LCEIRVFDRRMSGPKNNCLILGAGRSGTSLTALLLERAGYHVYTTSYPPDEGNPLGYFEDLDVIRTNESILSPFYRSGWRRTLRTIRRKPYIQGTGAWLLDLDYRSLKDISVKPEHAEKLKSFFSQTPFAYKDPRFSFTLNAVARFLPGNTNFICVFRHPALVVKSTLKQAARSGLPLDESYGLAVWEAHYRCLLEHRRQMGGQWFFVSYESLMNGDGASRLEEFLDVPLDRTLIKQELSRSGGDQSMPKEVVKLFYQLRDLESNPVGVDALNRA
jgi:hypothetical protein